MYKHALTFLALTASLTASAMTAQQQKTYGAFQAKKFEFLNSQVSKSEFAKEFKKLESTLEGYYQSFQASENPEVDSAEGNQMALDLELLEPLKVLSETKMTADDCETARHLNKQNSTPEEIIQISSIEKMISRLCK